jgi:alkanesulfonate monooxygenase SsuD/methylene tetrahydromethanopterin reductase-like flavin-dependent oxidoreductase (luciferase family)
MKFGLINFLENPVGRSDRQISAEQKHILIAAEEYGFDSVWQVEHHFSNYGHCVSAAVMLATVAAATSEIRLGSGVVALPFHNPIRVAEEFALLDLLSDGRLDFGSAADSNRSSFAVMESSSPNHAKSSTKRSR